MIHLQPEEAHENRATIMKVIVTNLETRGAGIEGDPVRRITQYWTLDGELLFEFDPCKNLDKKESK